MIQGIIAAMVTPMTDKGDIDISGIRYLVNKLIDSGVHGVFCLGTTGEFYALTNNEKKCVADTVLEEANGRVPVFVGTGAITTREVISLTIWAEKAGAQGASIVTPYFIKPTQSELYMHYTRIADSTSMPIVLYNMPSLTGNNLEVSTVEKLARVPNIVGIKDSSGDFNNILNYIKCTDNMFSVLAGNDSLIYKTLEAGGAGAVAATANVVPELVVSIYELWKNGSKEEAKKRQEQLKPLRSCFPLGTVPGVLKQAVSLGIFPVGQPRLPVTQLQGKTLEKLEKVISKYNEIDEPTYRDLKISLNL